MRRAGRTEKSRRNVGHAAPVVTTKLNAGRVGARGWRPSGREELLLQAALSPRSEAADAWRRLTRAVDVEELDAVAHDLLPLLYRSLAAAGVEDPWLGRLKGVYRRTWYGNQMLLRRAGEALALLGAVGVDAVVLGGASVGLLHYREVGARPMSDTSLAVPPAALGRARAVLSGAGPHTPPVSSADHDLWAARVPFEVAGTRAHAPCPADQLLRTCGIGALGSSRPDSCRWVTDALAILDSSGERIDWQRLVARAAERQLAPDLGLTLAYIRDRFGAPVPREVIRSLSGDAGGP